MSSNPSEFARRVLEAFQAAGHATDEEVGDAGGPSTTTMAKYRKVANGEMKMGEPRGDVLRRIDRVARWQSGSARALWREGRDPVVSQTTTLGQALGSPGSKPGRVIQGSGPDAYIQWLAERLTEVEERIDLLEAKGGDGNVQRMPASNRPADTDVSADPDELPAAAKEGVIEESGEFNT